MSDKLQKVLADGHHPVEVISADQAQRLDEHKERISAYDANINSAWRGLSVYAFLCGRELLATKKTLGHGNSKEDGAGFLKWLKVNFPKMPERTARRRMALAETLSAEIGHVADINKSLLLLEKNPDNADAAKPVMQAIHKTMDGRSITEFLRDEGKIRDKEHQKHTPAKPVSPDDELKAKRAQADAVIDEAIGSLRLIIQGKSAFDQHLSPGKGAELKNECAAFIRHFGEDKPKKGGKAK